MTNSAAICLLLFVSCACFSHGSTADPQSKCPPFYTYSHGDNTCLKVSQVQKTMKEAIDICSSEHDGRIAEIRDVRTRGLFYGMAIAKSGSAFWLGIASVPDGSRTEYMNGDPVTDVWSSIPASEDSGRLCVQFRIPYQPQLYADCNLQRYFVCQTNAL